MHPLIAKDCLRLGKHMVTASYVSKEMKAMANEAKAKDLLFLNEVGVDPGIDHMITMRVLDEIRSEGAELKTFQSFTGGLVAPESDNNPWHYKFSWNPRNVVLAGQGTSMFVQNGQYKYIPYQQVFRRYEELDVPNYGSFEGYANRDSLKYRATYGIEDCPTVFRGTLRRPGFCEAWDTFVQLGMTDDTYEMENVSSMTHRDFINSFLMWRPSDSVELKLAYHLGLSIDSPVMQKLKWLGIFENRKVGLQKGTPAQILQAILEKKWGLKKGEKDMVVMYNQFIYENKSGDCQEVVSTMVAKGDGTESGTAMARTVGLPLAIATKLVVNNQLPMFKGVHIPTHKEIYAPILNELEKDFGIEFTNQRNKIYRVKEDIHL
ncbi:Saccharopine dehydrogenase [Balamuthia mandrillaris]